VHGRKCIRLLVIALVIAVPSAPLALSGISSYGNFSSQSAQRAVSPEAISAEIHSQSGSNVEIPTGVRVPANLPQQSPISSQAIDFTHLTRTAGIIFSGTVSSIKATPSTPNDAIATVMVTFHVEKAMRGAISGQNFTLHQWMGLWSEGQRYQVGEHVLLFLYPPSRLGLTSVIGDSLGRFRVDAQGYVLFSAEQLAAFRTDPLLKAKTRMAASDFALTVRRAGGEE
jgi:hypothetical protein